MQLQKLVFLAQGYCLAILGHPLHFHNTHAWQWGPVIPKLYKALQQYGSGFVTDSIPTEDEVDPKSQEYEVIKGVWTAYGHCTGAQLSALTHHADTPWSRTWEKKQFGVIDNDLIADYYKKLVEAS